MRQLAKIGCIYCCLNVLPLDISVDIVRLLNKEAFKVVHDEDSFYFEVPKSHKPFKGLP